MHLNMGDIKKPQSQSQHAIHAINESHQWPVVHPKSLPLATLTSHFSVLNLKLRLRGGGNGKHSNL